MPSWDAPFRHVHQRDHDPGRCHRGGDLLAATAYLGLLAVVFAALLYHAGRMLVGEAPGIERGEVGRWRPVIMATLLVAVAVLGLYMPDVLEEALERMVALLTGGMS